MATTKQPTSIIGGKDNFWLYTKGYGFDLTHPDTPDSTPLNPRIKLKTPKEPIAIDPLKTALLPVDTQNYFLSPALGRPQDSVGLLLVEKLLKYAIPTCREATIRIAWVKYRLTDNDIQNMPPMMVATTGNDSNFDSKQGGGSYGEELGKVTIDGQEINAGRALMRDHWNTELYAPLENARRPDDLVLHKNRLSAFWRGPDNAEILRANGIRTLIFAGANLDQCVASTLLDAFHEGFDIILLTDGAATTSPDFARKCIQWNCEGGWGFLVSCEELHRGVKEMFSIRST